MSGLGEALRLPAGQQIRGKKKVAKATTINVKLRANVAGFGRKGSIVPVPPGVMRNTWFPKKMAEYQTQAQLKELGDVVIERDSTFGSPQEKERLAREKKDAEKRDTRRRKAISAQETLAVPKGSEVPAAPIEPAVPIEPEAPAEPEILSPEEAAAIVARLIPANIEFYRTPTPAPPPPKKLSPSLAATSALSAAAAAAAAENAKRDPPKPTKTGIYGSVSTADIAANLKAILWEDINGARVVISPENISFVEQLEDKDRVKHLGIYTIDIRLSPTETVRRTIQVKVQS